MPNERYQEQHVLSLCRVVSLLLVHEHRLKHDDTLNADAYLTDKLKLEIMFVELHFGRCCWFGGCGYTPRPCRTHLDTF